MLDLLQIGSAKSGSETQTPEIEYTRKPYRKKAKPVLDPLPDLKIQTEPNYKLAKIPELNFPQSTKPRNSLDNRISDLIEFGLNPDLPHTQRELKVRKGKKKTTINISDFIKKSHQQKILFNLYQADTFESSGERLDVLLAKERIPAAFSFSGSTKSEIHSVKNSVSHQILPPLVTKDSAKAGKSICKEEKLKKIDKILNSCEELLKLRKKEKSNTDKALEMLKKQGKKEQPRKISF